MRIDIIVPNFDEDSDDVTLSTWYKKVGDKITKNEVIADAETSTIACGITSSYDCVLAKILVKEGEIISQGTKIAVIETDLNSDMSDIRNLQDEVKEESEYIDDKLKVEEKEVKQEIAENKDNKLEDSIVMEKKNVFPEDTPKETTDEYILSVPLKKEIKEIDKELVEEAMELSSGIENDVVKDIVENDAAVDEKVIDEFSEHTEEKFMNILKTAEARAKEEAQKLREKILEEALKQAQSQAEDLKSKILKEYEEKATKDASEMHQKIIQGSLSEAENTKAKLIEEVKEKAKLEAEELKEQILKNAELEARVKAEDKIKDAVSQAEEKAKEEAEMMAKEIIEAAISESKSEAKEIKKDIIHSANKHAVKESQAIVKDVIKKARKKSHLKAEEMVESATTLASREAALLKEDILKAAREEIKEAVNSMLHSVVKEAGYEIRRSVDEVAKGVRATSEAQIERTFEDAMGNVMSEADSRDKALIEKTEKLEEKTEVVKKLLDIGDEGAPEMYADNWNKPQFFTNIGDHNEQIDLLRRRISEKMKDTYDASVISTVSNEVDMSAILALEKSFGKAFSAKHNTRLGFTPFFISACVAALKQYHVFNAHIRKDEIIYKNNYDISIITCGNDGIAAPVVRHADVMTIAEMEKTMISLSRRAVEGTLSVEEVSGGTFTVINAGIYGSLIGTDLLSPPQVATLSVHKMHNRPIATDNGVEIKPMLYISLSYDHRVADTKLASKFLSNVKSYVENPGWQALGL